MMKSSQSRARLFAHAITMSLACTGAAWAQDKPATTPLPQVRTTLPQEHEYQQQLHKFLGSLTAKDFDYAFTAPPPVTPVDVSDESYRTWAASLGVISALGGNHRFPPPNVPSSHFVLASIENAEKGIIRPSCWPEPTAWLANWDYRGNPYYGSRALKLRAFVTATVLMLMTDDLQEHSSAPKDARADWFGPHLVAYAYTYNAVRDVIPPEAGAAYETCLKKMMKRVVAWGPKGDETHFDICTVLGMRLAADAVKDAEYSKIAEAYAKRVFSDEWYYNPAGYFPDQGCFDTGFQGICLYWGTWLALAAPDWSFAQDAAKKAWRLRGYLSLPEPDGALVGPSHFNGRTSGDVVVDQWDYRFRAVAGAYLTDDAACQAKYPDANQLQAAAAGSAVQVSASPYESYDRPSGPWRWGLWPNTDAFPMYNFAYDLYPKGYFAHRQELEKNGSPLLKYPFARDGSFTEAFEKVFLIAKRPGFGVIVHTGPVSEFQGKHIEFTGPYGLSGGSLSAFWTPATGSVILGRRGGMQFPNGNPASFDVPQAWRTWPVHAVSGATANGKFFTSARCQKPEATYDVQGGHAKVTVTGTIPSVTMGTDKSLEGKIDYARTFEVSEKGLHVETIVSGDGKDQVAELYEVLPVFLRETARQPKAIPTTIEFQVAGQWAAGTDQFVGSVQAVRLARFTGAVEIRFDRPRRVKLSPAEWKDTYLGNAACRNVLIDLLESGDKAAAIKEPLKISYEVAPTAK